MDSHIPTEYEQQFAHDAKPLRAEIANLRAKLDTAEAELKLKQAEADGAGSLLLDVQQDCINEKCRADAAEARVEELIEDNAKFARESIELMESLPFVERYAWFAPLVSRRDRYYSNVGMIGRGGSFTPVGLAFRAAPSRE